MSQLNDVVAEGNAALADSEGDCIYLDAPDGAAVAVLGNPRAALAFAQRALAAMQDLPAAIAVNHGPLRVVHGDHAGNIVVGDGLSDASAIAQVAGPGRILASRPYRDALRRASPETGRYLGAAGLFTDPQDRTHELFYADPQGLKARRRRFFVFGALAAAAIVGLGFAGRYAIQVLRPAVIELDIKPQGEVFVDGETKGASPPLARLQVPAGKHTIEVRNARYKPWQTEIEVSPGETLAIKHTFTAAPAPKPAKRGLFDWLKK